MLRETPPDAEIIRTISSRFGVSITPFLIQDSYDVNNPPDIFRTSDPHLLLASGVIREIPLDFLAAYAPRYHGLRMRAPFGFDIGRGLEPDSVMGLKQYVGGTIDSLLFYSAYRLDWMEELGILPAGRLTPLDDSGRVYFTDTPFTYHEFPEIMRLFASGENYGLAIMEDVERLGIVAQLMGMWGLNLSIVNDNGRPNYYFADPRYKSFLQFMATMYAEGSITRISRVATDWQAFSRRIGVAPGAQTGWFQVSRDIFGLNQPVMQVLDRHPEARLLITPPEIGPYSDSGVGIHATVLPFNPYSMWVIGAHVSDEKLAAILQIYDYVSFDTEAYVLTTFGIAGDHFEWSGEPYRSQMIYDMTMVNRAFHSGAFVLSTFFLFPERDVFHLGDNALLRHSASPLGRGAVIRPYRQDVFGEFAMQYAALTAQFGDELLRIRQNFFSSAIRGEIDIDAMWDWYIDELHSNGLRRFMELVEQFPVVGT